jgi:hypothetical protein
MVSVCVCVCVGGGGDVVGDGSWDCLVPMWFVNFEPVSCIVSKNLFF